METGEIYKVFGRNAHNRAEIQREKAGLIKKGFGLLLCQVFC